MPASISHVLSATTPDDPAYEIRPSHWNSLHAVTLSQNWQATGNTTQSTSGGGDGMFISGVGIASVGVSNNSIIVSVPAGGGGGDGGNTISAGTRTATSNGFVQFGAANGITFGLNADGGQTLTASHNGLTSQSNQAFSAAGGSSAFQTLSFNNANGVSFSNVGGAVEASIATSLTNLRVSAGTTSNLLSALTFNNANGLSFGLDASTITASYTRPVVSNAIQSVGSVTDGGTNTSRFAADDHVHAGVFSVGVSNVGNTAGDTRVDVGRFVLAGGANITLSQATAANAFNTISIVGAAGGGGETRASVFAVSNTTQSTSGTIPLSLLSFQGNGIVSVGVSNGSVVLSATQSNQAFSAVGGSSAFQTLGFSDNAAASFTNTNGSVAIASVRASIFATSNTTQSSSMTQNLDSLIFAGAGIASVGATNGSVVISVPSGGGAGDGGVFAGVSNLGNTAGSTGTVSTGNFVLVGTNGVSLSQSTGAAGSAATVSIDYAGRPIPYWHNFPGGASSTLAGTTTRMMVQALRQDGLAFQGPMTLSTLYFAMSGTGTATANSSSYSTDLYVGLYTLNGSSLSLHNSGSQRFARGAATSNTIFQHGQRYLAIHSSAWSAQPVLQPGSVYWIGYFFSASNFSTSLASMVGVNFNVNRSGIWDSATSATSRNMLSAFNGYFNTNALPSSIAASQLTVVAHRHLMLAVGTNFDPFL